MDDNRLKFPVLFALSACTLTTTLSQNSKPNILFIAVDDLKPLLGCYGDSIAKTPNIDQLARKGAVFTSGYCQVAVSGPTRVSLLTGMYPDEVRVWGMRSQGDNFRLNNPSLISLPQNFKDNGYETVGIGKIFDDRTVDKGNDTPSWSVPFMDHRLYFDAKYPRPFSDRYQSPDTWALVEKYRAAYRTTGGSSSGEYAYIKSKVLPSTDCADVPDRAYSDGAITEGAIQFLNHYDTFKPLFLAVGFHRPHLPFAAPKKYWDLYNRAELPLAKFRATAADSPKIAYVTPGNYQEIADYSDIPPLMSFTDIGTPILPEVKQRELIHAYYASVSYVDAQIGKIIEVLKQKGMDKNTIVVLWGDHGFHLGDHNLWGKATNFENATRVPFIIYNPQLAPNEIKTPVEFVDFYPTLCEMAAIPKPAQLKGKSLLPLIKNEELNLNHYKYAVSQYARGAYMGYSIRDQKYRYTIWVSWSGKQYDLALHELPLMDTTKVFAEELYDYVSDPNETQNVVKQAIYQTELNMMKRYWREFVKEHMIVKELD